MGEAIARLTHEVVLFSALGIMSSEKLGNCSERWVYMEFCKDVAKTTTFHGLKKNILQIIGFYQ